MNTVDILRKGKAVLLARGWTQGTYVEDAKGNGPCCVMGACLIGAGLNPHGINPQFALADVEEAVRHAFRDGNRFGKGFSVIRWNDHDGRTKEQVIEALDKAIAYRAGLDELP